MKKIESEEMLKIEGGVPREEYCATLCCIISNNPYTDAMGKAWADNCAAYYACN